MIESCLSMGDQGQFSLQCYLFHKRVSSSATLRPFAQRYSTLNSDCLCSLGCSLPKKVRTAARGEVVKMFRERA